MTDTADDLVVRVEPTDRLQPGIDAALARVWSGAPRSTDADPPPAARREATHGGKRFRPGLVALVHDGLGGTADAAVPVVAAAVELLHTALVVHDDVIDGDDTRRGRHSVPGRFRAEAAEAGAGPRAAGTYAVAGAGGARGPGPPPAAPPQGAAPPAAPP